MALLRKRLRSSVDRRRSLAGVPCLHTNVCLEDITPATVALKVQLPRGIGFFDRFAPAVSERRYELDEFGTFVVRQIQQRKSVLEIVRAFKDFFGLSHRESELGVVAFIKMLMKRRLLSVAMEEPVAEKCEAAAGMP